MSQFASLDTPSDSPANAQNMLTGLTQDDIATIHRKISILNLNLKELTDIILLELGNLPVATLLNEVKRLHDIAYELGIQERKEMTRGKYLNIFRQKK